MKLSRFGSMLIGIVLLMLGGILVQDAIADGSSSARGKQFPLMVFVGGVYFLARAAIPPDDDQDRMI